MQVSYNVWREVFQKQQFVTVLGIQRTKMLPEHYFFRLF
jgi:hypothetical protein